MSSDKSKIRQKVWQELTEQKAGAFPFPLYGRIPNFKGARQASENLAGLPEFQDARVVKVNPDTPQKPVRERVLAAGKTLVMPGPRLKSGFYVLSGLQDYAQKASVKKNVPDYGVLTPLSQLPEIDIVVMGSVAVDYSGGRVGKGHGYGEIEYAIGREMGLIDEQTPVITTVHPLQVKAEVPVDAHDVPVDYLVTTQEVGTTRTSYKKPEGLIRDRITSSMVEEIPVLAECLAWKEEGS